MIFYISGPKDLIRIGQDTVVHKVVVVTIEKAIVEGVPTVVNTLAAERGHSPFIFLFSVMVV